MENQAPPWDVPLADRRGGFHQEFRLEMLVGQHTLRGTTKQSLDPGDFEF